MFGFGFPTSYFSPVNYDMTNGSTWGSMNLHMNQCWEDMVARQNLYQVPMYNFTGFSNYGSCFGNSYLLDPMWTIGQMQVASMSNGGMGIFSGMQFPWMQGTQTSSSSSKTDADKEAEARMKNEYDALKELLNTYKNVNTRISSDLKSKIETALKKTGKIEEKLAALEEAYKAIPKESLRKTMSVLDSKNTEYRQQLEAAGYKFGNNYSTKNPADSNINKTVNTIYNELSALKDKEYVAEEYQGAIEGNDILRLISYWNDKHSGASERNILNFVVKKLPASGHDREDAFNANVVPLVDALTDKAAEVASSTCFDDDTIEKLENLTDEVVKARDKGCSNTSNLTRKFEELYVMLRQMEAVRINSEMQAKYSFLNDISDNDNDFINDKIIIEETKADLKSEGLESVLTDIEDNITVTDFDDSDDVDVDEDEDPEVAVQEQVADLVNDGYLNETSIEYDGSKVYVETVKTGGRKYERVFIIKDGEIKELGNAKISNGTLCYVDTNNNTITQRTVTADSIEDAHDDTVDEAERAEATRKQDAEARSTGAYVWKLLNGWTSKGDSNVITDKLGNIDESNVLAFLDGVYAEAGWHHEGLFEKLDDDTKVSMADKRALLDAVLDKAEDLGLETSSNYLELKNLLYEHDIAHPGAKNYNQYHHGWGAWIFGFHTNYKEEIDNLLEKLYKEMKTKAAQA